MRTATANPAPAGLALRAAGPGDAEAIARLWHAGWPDGHRGHVPEGLAAYRRLADFRRLVPARLAHTTIATAGAGLAGFVVAHDDEVEQLYVAAESRGGGAAYALLRHAERQVAERYDVAWLAVAAGNARARRFYQRSGWYDAGGFTYAAETSAGPFPVPCRRYQKHVG